MRHGELIKRTRESSGMTRTQLSRKAAVDRGMLCHIEDGHLSGSVETLLKLARALDLDLNLLKEGSGTDLGCQSISLTGADSKLGPGDTAFGLDEDDIPTLCDPPSVA